jgi:hypothetical protein
MRGEAEVEDVRGGRGSCRWPMEIEMVEARDEDLDKGVNRCLQHNNKKR